jgi:hypothetical protein
MQILRTFFSRLFIKGITNRKLATTRGYKQLGVWCLIQRIEDETKVSDKSKGLGFKIPNCS